MDNRIIIGVVVVVAAIAAVGFYMVSTADVILYADDMQITLPHNYTADSDFSAAAGDVNISFVAQKGTTGKDFYEKFFKTISTNGKEAGYENVTNKTIGDIKVYEFTAHPSQLKNVSSNKEATSEGEEWTVYPPEVSAPFDKGVDHFRTVQYIKRDNVYTLSIPTTNPSANLYTKEINTIVDSIAPAAKK